MKTEKQNFGKKKRENWNEFEKSSIEKYKERFARWQTKKIDLLSFCINLNFTVSIAIMGFVLSTQDKPLFTDCVIKTSLFLLALTATFGFFALISRLIDFRLTMKTIESRRRFFELKHDLEYEDIQPSDKTTEEEKAEKYSSLNKCWGKVTLVLFTMQIVPLLVTIWILVLHKIYCL